MKVFLSLTLFFLSFRVSAGNNNMIPDHNSAVAAEILVRQVLDGNYLTGSNDRFNADLASALYGAGKNQHYVYLKAFNCPAGGAGAEDCTISILAEPNSFETTKPQITYDLEVFVWQGQIMSVQVNNINDPTSKEQAVRPQPIL